MGWHFWLKPNKQKYVGFGKDLVGDLRSTAPSTSLGVANEQPKPCVREWILATGHDREGDDESLHGVLAFSQTYR